MALSTLQSKLFVPLSPPKVKTFGRRILDLASAPKLSLADALVTSNAKF